MAGRWFLFLLWIWHGFKEPSHHDPIAPSSHSSNIKKGGKEWFKPFAICEDICCLGLCLLLWHHYHSRNFIIPFLVFKWLMDCLSSFIPPAGNCVEHKNIIL